MRQLRAHGTEDLLMRGLLLALAATIIYNGATQPPQSISLFAIIANRPTVILVAALWALSLVAVSACWSPYWRRIGGQAAIGLCVANAAGALWVFGPVSPYLRTGPVWHDQLLGHHFVPWLIAAFLVAEVASRPACEERRRCRR